MKIQSTPSEENKELLQTIIMRQTELQNMTFSLIKPTTNTPNKQQQEMVDSYNWFSSLKHNNTTLLSKAV